MPEGGAGGGVGVEAGGPEADPPSLLEDALKNVDAEAVPPLWARRSAKLMRRWRLREAKKVRGMTPKNKHGRPRESRKRLWWKRSHIAFVF